jgi:hypothetical protein
MVTAEFAVALPAFVVIVVAALGGVGVVTAQLRCADAAGVAARLAARGEGAVAVRSAVMATAPRGATVQVATSATTVTATVRARVSLPGMSRLVQGIVVGEQVVDALETGPVGSAGAP